MEIEKNIPIPPKRGVVYNIPFNEMVSGDSVLIEENNISSYTLRARIHRELKLYNKKHDTKIEVTTRKLKNHNCFRVWRIK